MTTTIYLDNSATTGVREEVVEAMLPYLKDKWGNPSSIHKLGRQARAAVDLARQQVASLIGAQAKEIYFTPCGTHSNNLAILGRARFVEANGKGRHLITSCIEHSSVLGPAKYLESLGWKVTYLHVNGEGFIDLRELENAISPETSIISLMWANNEVGTVQSIDKLAQIAQAKDIYFHTDAVQCAGKIAIDLNKLKVNALSLSGHKFYAPKGIGVLYIKEKTNVMPIVFGGGQEMGLHPGTESLANIVAIGKAAELASHDLEQNQARLKKMQNILLEKLTALKGVKLTGATDLNKRVPGHISVVVKGAIGEEIVVLADFKGVCISSVSACKQTGNDPSHVLNCMGLPREDVIGSARITVGRFNTEEECEKAANILNQVFSSFIEKASKKALVN